MSREDRAVGRQPQGERELDAINQLLAEEPELAPAFEAMVASLDEARVTAEGWEALRARLDGEGSATARGGAAASSAAMTGADRASAQRDGAPDRPGMRPARGDGGPLLTGAGAATQDRPPPRSAPSVRWAVGLALVAAVVVAGSWASLQAGEAARLRDDQRILAYWMANPAMQLVALDDPGPGPTASARLGIVCLLPDGRALLLQPSGAPRGATYVVTGDGPGGSRELARGRGNMLQFDASGVDSVEVSLARGADSTVVAQADLAQLR